MPSVTVNSFIEDTAVLVATAFLIVRGPLERMLANPLLSGLAFGAIAASEAIFPNARFPYASHTLGCAFITALIGLRGGVIAAGIATLAAFAFGPPIVATVVGIQIGITVLVIAFFRKLGPYPALFTGAWIALSQTASVAAAQLFPVSQASVTSFWTIPANTFGVVLLALVIRDARTRSDAERHQQEVADARTLAVETELLMLRGRVHPHFLYNALTSIAALCEIAPKRASKAAINLGSLMRQSLEPGGNGETRPLRLEMETVWNYAEIEMERFGQKLKIHVDIGGCEDVEVPPFGVQILVENAILHGISPLVRGGVVSVIGRKNSRFAFVAVADDGVGLPEHAWKHKSMHGLNILEALVRTQSRPGGRLRLVRRVGTGTLAVLRIPLGQESSK